MPDQTMNSHTFILEAVPENFAAAQEQVRAFLAPCSCSMRTLLELDMLVEEIFINIASYAYPDKRGTAAIDLALNDKKDRNRLPISPLPPPRARLEVWESFSCKSMPTSFPTSMKTAKTACLFARYSHRYYHKFSHKYSLPLLLETAGFSLPVMNPFLREIQIISALFALLHGS